MVKRLAALFLIAIAASGCRFLVAGHGKVKEVSMEEIDAEIARVQGEIARGNTSAQPVLIHFPYRRTGMEGLFEMRSLCQVRHSRVFSASAFFASMGIELWRGGTSEKISTVCIFVFLEPLGVAMDIVQVPIQLCVKTAKHLGVSRTELNSALKDLAKARSLGLEDPYVTVPFDWPLPAPLQLDTIGYRLPAMEAAPQLRVQSSASPAGSGPMAGNGALGAGPDRKR